MKYEENPSEWSTARKKRELFGRMYGADYGPDARDHLHYATELHEEIARVTDESFLDRVTRLVRGSRRRPTASEAVIRDEGVDESEDRAAIREGSGRTPTREVTTGRYEVRPGRVFFSAISTPYAWEDPLHSSDGDV